MNEQRREPIKKPFLKQKLLVPSNSVTKRSRCPCVCPAGHPTFPLGPREPYSLQRARRRAPGQGGSALPFPPDSAACGWSSVEGTLGGRWGDAGGKPGFKEA